MPKFMTYQRPAPVNKNAWAGRPGANPYQPPRKGGRQLPEGAKPGLPAPLLGAQKSS
jgi:hypothetical protein